MPVRRSTSGVLESTAFAALVLAVAGAALGAVIISSPRNGAAAVGGLALVAAGFMRPKVVLYVALLSMVWTPNNGYPAGIAGHFGSYPEVQKSLIWLSALFLGYQRGFDRRLVAPLLAYPLVAVISWLGGTPAPGLHLSQTLSTLASLTAAWALLAVRWDLERDRDVLVLIALIPLLTLAVGLLLDLGGIRPALDLQARPHRLQGAGIPSSMGNSAIVAFAAAALLQRARLWRFAGAVAVIDVGLLFGSLARAAMIALLIAAVPALTRILRAGVASGRAAAALRMLLLVGAAVAAASVVIPAVQERNGQKVYVPGVGAEQDATSGRSEAWGRAYDAAKVNIVFGRGIGAGPAIGSTQQFFLAQHNEYLRMLLEGGYVGGILVLLAIVGTLVAFIARSASMYKPELYALCLGTATLAVTDNPLTSPTYAARWTLLVGITVGVSRWRGGIGSRASDSGRPPIRPARTSLPVAAAAARTP